MTDRDRRNQLHEAALRVIDDFTRAGVPYLLYLRKFDFHVLHGPDDARRELLENHLLDSVAELGGNMVSIQEPGDAVASYIRPTTPGGCGSGGSSAVPRRSPGRCTVLACQSGTRPRAWSMAT